MELKVPKEQVKDAECFELSSREDIDISEVVRERQRILDIRDRNWVPRILDAFSARLIYLNGRLAEEYLKYHVS